MEADSIGPGMGDQVRWGLKHLASNHGSRKSTDF